MPFVWWRLLFHGEDRGLSYEEKKGILKQLKDCYTVANLSTNVMTVMMAAEAFATLRSQRYHPQTLNSLQRMDERTK